MTDSPRFSIIGVTDNFLKAYQKEESDVLKKGFFEIFGNSDSDEPTNKITDLLALFSATIENRINGKLEGLYLKLKKEDGVPGEGTYTDVEITPVLNESDLPASIIVSFKETENKAVSSNWDSENNLNYRNIVENSLNAFFLTKPDGTILVANKAACDLFGYSVEELRQIGPQGIIDHSQARVHEKIRERKETGKVRAELVGIKKSGEKFPLEVYSVIFSDVNGEERSSNSIIEITDRKNAENAVLKSEYYLHEAQKMAKMGSWNFDFKEDKLIWTEGLYDVFGANKETFLETHGSFINLVIKEDRAFVVETSRQSQLTGAPFNIEYRITTADGESRIIEEFGYSEKNDQGAIVRLFGTAQDITSRKRVEQALTLSERKYKTLFEDNPLPMIIWDFETLNIIDCNEETLIKYGYTRDEFLQLSIRDIRPKEDILLINTATANETAYGRIHKQVWRHLKKNGELMQMEITGHLIDYNGKKASLVLLNDLTEKKNLEVLLSKSNRLAAIGSWEIDVINGSVYWSDITKEIREVDPDFVPELSTGISHFKEGESRETISKRLKDCIENGTPWDEELQIFTHKGNLKWIRTIGEAELINSTCIRVCGSFQDITERKQAEQQIQSEKFLSDAIINSLPGIFYMSDRDGRLLRWNHNLEFISEYSAEEIKKMNPLDFVDEEERELMRSAINSVFLLDSADATCNLYTKSKNKIPYYFTGHKIKIGEKDFLVGVGIDISERARAEKELMDYTQEIKKLTAYLDRVREEERSRIAREIHDELGQQLTGLKMDASWVAKRILPEEKLHSKLIDMIGLIDQTIKTVRRISTDLRPGILDDLGLIAALEWQCGEFQKKSEIKCVFHSNIDDLAIERNMATGIFRIYQESLTNVLRHAEATRIESCVKQSETGITLIVKDNGQGFDQTEIKKKGTLGLIGMRERASILNGKLHIESESGKGTSVMLSIAWDKIIEKK